jgi:hypothetical protein
LFKVCARCRIEKDQIDFNVKKDGKLFPWCKTCRSEYNAEYNKTHKSEKSTYNRQYRQEHLDFLLEKQRNLTEEQREIKNARTRRWKQIQGIQGVKRQTDLQRKRRNTDPQTKLKSILRTRQRKVINRGWKTGSAVRDLGCSVEALKLYLESKFQSGMTWENHGKGPDCWHIDHIIPLSAFDLTNRQHFVLAFHFANLQPLWSVDNMTKHAKYPKFLLQTGRG